MAVRCFSMFLSISAYDFELGLLPSTHGSDGVICLLVAAAVVAVAVVFCCCTCSQPYFWMAIDVLTKLPSLIKGAEVFGP